MTEMATRAPSGLRRLRRGQVVIVAPVLALACLVACSSESRSATGPSPTGSTIEVGSKREPEPTPTTTSSQTTRVESSDPAEGPPAGWPNQIPRLPPTAQHVRYTRIPIEDYAMFQVEGLFDSAMPPEDVFPIASDALRAAGFQVCGDTEVTEYGPGEFAGHLLGQDGDTKASGTIYRHAEGDPWRIQLGIVPDDPDGLGC